MKYDPKHNLCHAALLGDFEQIKRLVGSGCNIDVVDSDGRTALMQVAVSGNAEIVEFLLENRASLDIQDDQGWAALSFAITHRHFEIACKMLDRGANVSLKTNHGNTPLSDAIFQRASCQFISKLIQLGADTNQKNLYGVSASDLAETMGYSPDISNGLKAL